MKQIISILILLLYVGGVSQTFSGSDLNSDQKEIEELIESFSPSDFMRLDSVYQYRFTSDFDSVPYIKRINTYLGNNIELVYSRRMSNDSGWNYDEKKVITLNNYGEQESYASYNWRNDSWLPDIKDTYIYTSNSNERTRYTWNINGGFWAPEYKYYRKFDDNDREVEFINSDWSVSMNTWVYTFKGDKTFDNNGNEILFNYNQYNHQTSSWDFFMKDSAYYSNGRQEYWERSYWNKSTDNWGNYEKRETSFVVDTSITFTYSWHNNMWNLWSKHVEYKSDYDTSYSNSYNTYDDSTWVFNYKIKYILADNDDLRFQESYRRESEDHEWYGTLKFSKSVNEFGRTDTIIHYTWDYYYKQFVPTNKRIYCVNDEGVSSYTLIQVWNVDFWEKYENSVFYYTNLSSVADKKGTDEFYIYPNPASTHINLTSPNAILQLHTLHGQAILHTQPGEQMISLNGVPPGVYVATIKEGKKIIGRERLIVR